MTDPARAAAQMSAILSPEFRAVIIDAAGHLETIARSARNVALLIESNPLANVDAIVAQMDRAMKAIEALHAMGDEHSELIKVLRP